MLFSVGGLASIYEGTHKLSHNATLEHPWIAIGVLLFSIVLELFSLFGALREINKFRGSQSLIREQQEIAEVLNLITLQLGPDIMVAVKVKMKNINSAMDLINSLNKCEEVLKKELPQIKWSFFEPDHYK